MLRKPKGKKQTRAHAHAPKQEKKLAKRLGAKTVRRSGAGDEKGDVRVTSMFRVECKCTQKKSFSINQEMLRKIEEAAMQSGEAPAIQIEFLDEIGMVTSAVAVVPVWVLNVLVNVRE